MSIERKPRDAYQPDDRAKDYFPEGTFAFLGILAGFSGILCAISGVLVPGQNLFETGLGLLLLAGLLFVMKAIIGAFYDIREYQARRAKWGDGEGGARERQESAS